MWPVESPLPDQADKSTQTSPDLPSRWEQVTSGSFSPLAWVDRKAMHDELERLRQQVKIAKENAVVLHRARLLAEEQSRQRGELLENAMRETKAARQENRILTTKIATLQAGADAFSDEEAKREMALLYHDLEHWTFTHFGAKPSSQQSNEPTPQPERLDISTLEIIQSEIAGLIYQSFWNRFMVGTEDHFWSNYLRKADSEVNKQFSNHISRHWRCAMSTAILSLETDLLQERCNGIIKAVETCFGRYAVTDRPKRMQQLQDIVGRCIKLKHKLQCQEDTYIFWSHQYGVPFRDEKMRIPTEKDTSDGFVKSSLWPGLWKIIRPGEWSIVEKEIVNTLSPLAPSIEMIDELESQQGDTDSGEI
ncbi:hypothetical protein N7491_001872 [Penicillium cf. griseofulvum]|uniref:Uncharacterized protein n=1 Tax=Penicillium cf. griseofulvum TaxID=2972120 RepID=A0A9W9T2Y0_9EURO|nr:hypothetical protein N7472_003947 [Penicillium cf. griseofulvum]KAJ5445790.1 hypothetical protein N7491_001872 [Penicillium cf. griseofulvum]KAJ5447512.1 hypothetical protein N7445_002333 [Penicillium cf. griseofulvum]